LWRIGERINTLTLPSPVKGEGKVVSAISIIKGEVSINLYPLVGESWMEGCKYMDSRFRGNDILMSLLRKQESRRGVEGREGVRQRLI
jgi:hypothetical protein